jgi:hypothetical protein
MRPYVILRYCAAEAWSSAPCPGTADGPSLENASTATAYDVRTSTLTLACGDRYEFPAIDALGALETRELEPSSTRRTNDLTRVISRDVVRRVLAGQSPVMKWSVRITYRDEADVGFETCCEIRVVRLPLEIRSAVVPCQGGHQADRLAR